MNVAPSAALEFCCQTGTDHPGHRSRWPHPFILPSVWANHAFGAPGRPVTKQENLLDHVKAQTLVLVGRDDWICPVAEAQRLNKGIQNSRLMVLGKSGHFPWIEAPKQFFAEVIQFAK